MNFKDIAKIRFFNQQLAGTKYKTSKELVTWMGAIQAQDYAMSKWALGIRLPFSTDNSIEKELDKGKIIRTHALRPTWHFVSSEDIYWILELSGPRIKSLMKSRNKELELTESVFKKSNALFKKALTGGKSLVREELALMLNKNKIKTDNNRLAHLFLQAELDGIICNGPSIKNKRSYALLSERVPVKNILTKEEALARLAKCYFTSHCPATLKDFTWWSGLSITDAKNGYDLVKSNFIEIKINSEIYLISDSASKYSPAKPTAAFLPSYDEFLISYKNRSASLSLDNHRQALSVNGIFRPVIIIDGQVKGLWSRTIKNDKVYIVAELFKPGLKTSKKLIETSAEKFGFFLNKKMELSFKKL